MMNPFSNPSYLLPPLLGAFVTILLLVLVWQKGRRDFSSRIFCCLLLSVGLWALFVFGMRSSPDTHQAVLWARLIVPTAFAIFVFYYHFSLAYTGTRGQQGILLVSYLFLVIAAGLISTRLLVDRMVLEDYGYAPIMGTVGLPIVIGAMLLVGGGTYNLLRRYKVSHSYEERNRLLYLVIASLFPLLGGVLDGFSDLPPAAIWTNLIFCIICSIAILKYHLLDIRVVVRKSLVYLLVSSGIAIPYVSLLYLLNYIIEPKLGQWWIHALIILLLAIVLRPLYSSAQQMVDRLFYRDRYDALRTLQQFIQQSRSIVNLEKLGSNLVQLVSGALRTSSVCLLLPREENHGLVMASSTGLEIPPSGVVLRDSSPLVRWLGLHGDIISSEQLDIIPQLQSLSLKEKNNLERMGAKIYVPIRTNQGQLSGILVLGQKLSHQSYSEGDNQLLTAVSNQMAMALENARLYEETRESERMLRESEEFNFSLLSNSPHPILVINPDTSVRYVNPALEKLTSFTSAELIGRKAPYLWWTEETLHKTREDFAEDIRKGVRRVEELFQTKNGERFWVEMNSIPVIVNGEFKYYLSLWLEITERKQAEEALWESEEKYKSLVSNVKLGIFRSTPEPAGRFLEVNPAMEEITGYSREELLRMNVSDLYVHPEERRAVLEVIASTIGKTTKELRFRKKDETEITVSDTKVDVRDDTGKVLYFDGIIEDITERKRAEETLRESEGKWRSLAENAPGFIINIDRNGIIRFINRGVPGISVEDATGQSVYSFVEPGYRDTAKKTIEQVFDTGEPGNYEVKGIGLDGQTLAWYSTAVGPIIHDGQVVAVTLITTDITERKRAEEKYQDLIQKEKDIIYTLDDKGNITFSNPAVETLLGYRREELMGKNFMVLIPKEWQEKTGADFLNLLKTGEITAETVLLDKEGQPHFVEYSSTTIKEGDKIVGTRGIVRDITERKEAEEREKKLQQELYLSSRLASIGELAAGVAHEINNPLTGVLGFSQRLLRKSTDEEFSRGLEIIHSEAQRAAKVVQNLLTFARYREPTKEYSDINDIVQKALELRAYELKTSNIEVVTDLDPGLPMTITDFRQIEEVFLNIIVNAEQAMTETNREGKLTVKTQVITGNIRVSFTDDGPGIPAEHLDKLFNPFFTTRGQVGGTGLGLSICHGIVVEHGGRIYATSKPGKGTTFIVELPVITEEADKTKIVEE